MIGIAVITILGSLLHFVFDWSGQWYPIGIIAAVNESVWEHFKIGFWPALFFGFFEYGFIRNRISNFYIAKAAGIYAIPVTIAILFYSYTAIFGVEILAVDILIFIIAIAICQIISYKILTADRLPHWFNTAGIILIVLLGILFAVFTFFPPHLPIFLDANTGTYGIH